MSKRYPADEFDSVPEVSKREGTHRDWIAYTGPGKRLRPLLIMGVLVLLVGVVMYALVRPWSFDAFGEATVPEQSESGKPAAGPKSSPAGAGQKESSKLNSDKPKGSASPSASSPASASPSKSEASNSAQSSEDIASLEVGIYNATPVDGAAKKTSSKLKSKGYKPSASDNWTRMEDSSTVYYKDSEDGDAAAKLAHELDIGGTYQIDSIPEDITVVIGQDHQAR